MRNLTICTHSSLKAALVIVTAKTSEHHKQLTHGLMVRRRAPAGCGRARGEAVCWGAWETLAGGNRVVETRGEAATAVHHGAPFRQLLQDASSPGGRAGKEANMCECCPMS